MSTCSRAVLSIAAILQICVQGLAAPPQTQPSRPNVVILFPDQLRWAELGCYGHPSVRSPNIDRLASEGVRFTHAFSNYPVCSPARSILLSGRYARSTGVVRNQDNEAQPGRPTNTTPTLAEVLKSAGYDTALVGKWHLRPTPQDLGFQHTVRCRMRHRYYKQTYYRNEKEEYVCEEYSPHHETEEALRFIRERRSRPFFLFLSYGPPHMPLSEMPEKYKIMYDPAKVLLRDNVWKDGKLAYNEEWFKIYLWDFQYYQHKDTFSTPLPAGMDLRQLTALYDGQITAVDDCIGRVLGGIRDAGIEEETVVLFTSDHGDLLGSHEMFNKHQHYDEASRVPMLIRYPRNIKPRVIDGQVASLVDVTPTLLELCGVAVPGEVQGTSLAPVLTDVSETVGESAAFIETRDEGVRTRRWLYWIDKPPPHKEHLFDCDADPFQTHDLAGAAKQGATLADLQGKVQAWRARTPVAPGEEK